MKAARISWVTMSHTTSGTSTIRASVSVFGIFTGVTLLAPLLRG
jgi:hypothetical protein